jgi:hypothetical protein
MSVHIEDDAALYALGLLDERDSTAIEEHVRECEACRASLAQAEADVAAIETASAQFEPPALRYPQVRESARFPGWFAAVAAAVLIALLPSAYLAYQNVSMHAEMQNEAQAMARIASSPHRVASFTGLDAKVMYGKDGSWYCIIIRGAQQGLQIVWPHDGVQTVLGTASTHGDVAWLYLPKSHRMDTLSVVLAGRTVAQARLNFI